jgi:hypothetical protein
VDHREEEEEEEEEEEIINIEEEGEEENYKVMIEPRLSLYIKLYTTPIDLITRFLLPNTTTDGVV